MGRATYLDDESRWAAVLDRDPAGDGHFVYAVASTGIYCRPSCPARRPRREGVAFFAAPEAAEQAGYRPCLRCRPTEANGQHQAVAEAMRLLDESEPTPSLADLGQAVGMSPSHLQRIFKRATGLSPREYAAMHRAQRLRAGLQAGEPVSDALYNAGYGSVRALYETAHRDLGMSPGAYQRGGQGKAIRYTLRETPLGPMLLAATDRGVCALRFGEADRLLAELAKEFPKAVLTLDQQGLEAYSQAVVAHLLGKPRLDLPLDVQGTAFQQRVWAALRAIPYGETRTYTQVAALIGEPKAVRAVARACATNPVALVVPCHRVVRKGGELSGYRWGVERKRRLLNQERAGDRS